MNPLLLNTYDNVGGAAIATYRLHCGLRSIGLDSRLMVMHRGKNDPTVIGPQPQSPLQRALASWCMSRDAKITNACMATGNRYFSPARCPDNLVKRVAAINPDLLHLFWMNSGFMKIETLRQFNKPIVWTLHDMWPITGGCHYDDECGKFRQSCGNCPVLGSTGGHDLSRQILRRKQQSWGDVPIVVVATSDWLADMARASSVFRGKRIEVIPNGLDTDTYKPLDKRLARDAFGLPQDKNLILFSAMGVTLDKRKGSHLLIPALKQMAQAGWGECSELVIVGASPPENPQDLGIKAHYMGQFQDEISQVLLYSAADVTVVPSTQENLSNTVMESLSCGTPVVAFNIGGMPDMIDHQSNGYLARPFESDDLAEGIMWVLDNHSRLELLSQQSRKTAIERYTLDRIANRYLSLYQEVLKA